MDYPCVSVVLMIRGQARHIVLRALESVFKQTAGNLRIIISDTDSSEYGTGVRLQEDFENDDRVTFMINRPEYSGLSFRNALLPLVDTEFVCFMDGGEVWKPEKIENQLEIMRSGREIAAVYCNGRMYFTDKNGVKSEKCFLRSEGDVANWVTHHPVKAPGQILYRAESLRQVNGFDDGLSELCDMDALFRLRDVGSVAKADESLLDYHVSSSAARIKREFSDQESLLSRKRYIDMLLSGKKVCFGFYLSLVRLALRARMPIEIIWYSFIMLLRAPVQTARLVVGSLIKLIKSFADTAIRRRVCERHLKDIRRKVLSKTELSEHSYSFGSKQEPTVYVDSETVSEMAVKKFGFIGSGYNGVLVIPDGVTEIAEGAFAGCSSVKQVIVAGSVRRISTKAFMDCTALETVVFNHNSRLAQVDDYAFAGCINLISVSLPNSVSFIGKGAFMGCQGLLDLSFISFANTERENDMFAEHIEVIAEECFAGCKALEAVRFGKGSLLREFGAYSFFDCESLRLLWVEASPEKIGSHAFEGCVSLSEIVMTKSESVKQLGDYVFAGCERIYHFAMPPAVTVIPKGAFEGCTTLQGITLPIRVNKVKKDAFVDCQSMLSCVIENPEARVSAKAFSKYTKVEFKSNKDIDEDALGAK